MALFTTREGFSVLFQTGNIDILAGDFDPSVTGVAASEGSVFFSSVGNLTYKKTGSADTDWESYSNIEGGGLLWNATDSSEAGTACEVGDGYVINADAAFTKSMPASPAIGDRVGFATLGNADTNNVTLDFNGNNFNGAPDSLLIDLNYAYFDFLYTGDATTGWVLSNSDESGNIVNIRTFIGNDDNADPAVTEFTEENVVTAGDSLEDAIDNLDIEAGDVRNFIGKDTDADDLPNYTERSTDVDGGTYVPDYVNDDDDLELSVARLDKALQDISGVATAGVKRRPFMKAITGDDPSGVTTSFSDDTGGQWDSSAWQSGDKILSTNASAFGKVYSWDGSAWVDAAEDFTAYDAAAFRFDFLDSSETAQQGAAYMMNEAEDEIFKIADYDYEDASGIALSDAYTPASGDIDSTDVVQSAIQKIDGNNDAQDTLLGTAQGDTDLGNTGLNVLADNTTVSAALETVDTQIGEEATFVGRDTATTDDMPSYSTLAGDTMGSGYAPQYIVDGDNLELSIAKLDNAIQGLSTSSFESLTQNITTTTVLNTYTAADNVGAKYIVFAWDGTGNRYAAEIFAMNNDSAVDSTEYGILELGTLSVYFSVSVNGSNIELSVDPNGNTVSVKIQRNLITNS